jgi:uncharacterized protein (TIGR03067 family)
MTTLTAVLASLVLGLNCGGAENPPGEDLGRLQGCWIARTGPRQGIEVRLEFSGHNARFTVRMPNGQRIEAEGQFELDENVTPKSVDWVKFRGPDDQELPEIPAIYRLDAESFVVCSGGLNNGRPKEFRRGDGLLTEVVTFHRLDGEPAAPSVADPTPSR